MSTKKKVLITGGTGLLSSAAWLYQEDKWDITFISRSKDRLPRGKKCVVVSLEESDKLKTVLEEMKPSFILHTASLTSVEQCEENKYKAYLSNVLTTSNIAKTAAQLGIKLVHVSTDHFSSEGDLSSEDEIGFPQNNYALTKLQAEFEVKKYCPDSLIIRTNFFSWGLPHRKAFLDFIVDNCLEQKKITLFDDIKFNPISAKYLLHYIDLLLEINSSGVFNVAGDELLTKYEFGMKVCDEMDVDSSFVAKGSIDEQVGLVLRPKNLSISNEKLKKTLSMNEVPSVQQMLKELREEEKQIKLSVDQQYSNPKPPFVSYGKQTIDDSDFDAVMSTLASSYLTQGPKVEEFEAAIARYVGAKYAVAMNNWTSGLHMSMLALGVGPGDFVVTTPLSFVASSNCIVYVGAQPIFVDIDPETLNIDVEKVAEACRSNKNVKAIIPVHFAGAPCEMKELREVANKYNVSIVEDAAHALGGSYLSGERIGNPRYSEMIGFSFHPVKNITTGEGGAITTNSEVIYQKLLKIRSHGINKGFDSFENEGEAFHLGVKNHWYYEMQELGYNFRITDLQCALGLSQMKRIDHFFKERQRVASLYDKHFSSLPNIKLLQKNTRSQSGNHLYVIGIEYEEIGLSRFEVFEKFKEKGIQVHVHYIPITNQPFYKNNYKTVEMPNSEKYYAMALTLPIYPLMTNVEVERVVESLREIVG